MKLKRSMRYLFPNKGLRGFMRYYLLFLSLGLLLLLFFRHGSLVMLINKYSAEWLDLPVLLLSDVGLGSTIAVVAVLLAFFRIRYALMGLFNLAMVGLLTGLFKNVFFQGYLRPISYFGADEFYRLVTTAEPNYFNSFPSGHTMAIFGFLSLVAYFTGKQWAGVLFFFVALAVGFSRIYLCQHFIVDVYFGSVFGMLATAITLWVSSRIPGFDQGEIFQKPIYRISFK
ncbi:MAG: phosphatase PAP2 family protein [Mangrovibacterium sp.]